jgi:ParB family chromosome partitioning protein
MLNARTTLDQMQANLEESMGVRDHVTDQPRLSPTPRAKDLGRRPDASFGTVAIDRVISDPSQPRDVFSDDGLDRLARSIREKGQLSPIRVRWSEENDRWIIIAGERRWQATQRAGLPTIDCYFHDGNLTDSEVLEQQLIENLLREDLRPIEEARAFCRLIEMNGWNGKQLSEALHVAPAKVSRSLALLKLPADVQEQVASGQLSSRSAYELSKVTDKAACRKLAAKAVVGKWTHDRAANAVRTHRGKRRRASTQIKQTFATEAGWKIVASHAGKTTYHELKAALAEVIDEIDARIAGRVQFY